MIEESLAVSPDLPEGLDVEAGLYVGGAWSSDEVVANLIIEPVTADTAVDVVARSSEALIEAQAESTVETKRRLAGGKPAFVQTYTSDEDKLNAVLAFPRGDYFYALTFTGAPDQAEALEDLVGHASETLIFTDVDAAGRAALDELRAFTGTGYQLTLPPGWRATGSEALDSQPLTEESDALLRGYMYDRGATNAEVRVVPTPPIGLDRLAVLMRKASVREIERQPATQVASVKRLADIRLDGVPAIMLEFDIVASGIPIAAKRVALTHDGSLYVVSLYTPPRRADRDGIAYQEILRSWRWADG